MAMPDEQPLSNEAVRGWLLGLQQSICDAVGAEDGTPFLTDAWERPPGGRLEGAGITRLIEGGALLERGGCAFSQVRGPALPPSATQHRPELAGAPFEAMGVSLVFHPRNPYVPTVHMNVRMLSATPTEGPAAGQTVRWFGGGMDLTPYYGFEEDAVHFHRACRDALAPHDPALYPRFKAWCDEYFFLKHRNEPRGIGGIFYDYLNSAGDAANSGWEEDFAFTRDVGLSFLDIYPKIVRDNFAKPWTEADREEQLIRRGRYVEFNLLHDRGTIFGLKTGGNVASILSSMPPLVRWP